jgi:hypothetical protein
MWKDFRLRARQAMRSVSFLSSGLRSHWLGLGLLVAAAAAAQPAHGHFFEGTADWVGHKRTLCYRLYKGGEDTKAPNIGDDLAWKAWIKHAVDKWNDQTASRHGSRQTIWRFVPCPEGQEPDIVFRFDKDGAHTNNRGGASTGGIDGVAKITQATVWVREDITDQFVFDKNKNAKKPSGGRNGKGWSRNGETTLDPVLVIMHELTHVMRLDHSKSKPVDTGDFEESIGIGNRR